MLNAAIQARWTYGRSHHDIEYGLWAGGPPPVFRPHFHAEGQLTTVLAGWRAFRVGGEVVTVAAGQCLYIPAGQLHQGIAAGGPIVRCINTYATPSLGDRPVVVDLPEDGAIGTIAADEGVSREHFSRRFRRVAGIGPQGFRLLRRLNEARLRLKGPDSIAAIAADLGFADQSHLGRLFRQAFGVTPRAYRLMMR